MTGGTLRAALLAHGIGGREDLPLPFGLTVAGASAALVVSFLGLVLLRPQPRIDGARAGLPLPPAAAKVLDGPVTRRLLAGLGLVPAAYVLLVLVAGRDDADNPMPWIVYIHLWLGLVVVSVLLGPVWRRLNPLRSVHALLNRALGLDPQDGVRPLPAGIGYWPTAAGLLGFAWLELVHPDNASLTTLRIAVGMYAAVHLLAAFVFGARWFDRGDAFEAWSGLVGRLSVLGRRDDGRLVLRRPLAGLDALPPAPGLAAVAVVMLGTTAFDGLSGAPRWVAYAQSAGSPTAVRTAGLIGCVALMGALFVACTRAAGRIGGLGGAGMPGQFAPSVVPVALGYLVAHYYSLFVLEGQRSLAKLSDPLSRGEDWFGTADLVPATAALDPTLVSVVQVLAIVVGHVLGVVLAHDRAVRLFPRRVAVIGQLPLLVLMVALTCTGLLLLFAG